MKKNDLLELRNKTKEEISKLIQDGEAKLFSLQLEKNQSSLKDIKSVSKHRKYIAKLLTVQNEIMRKEAVNE